MSVVLLAMVLVAAGLLWCHLVPREADRFGHVLYVWAGMAVATVVLTVAKIFFPGLY